MMFMDQFSLEGLVGIVTGGGQGIGRVYCHAFAEAGADVVVAEFNAASGEETAAQVTQLGRQGLFVQTDVCQVASVDAMVERTLRHFGKIDFLVNNAARSSVCPTVDLSEEEWRSIFDVNLNGTFFCCQAVGRHMIERRSGSIIGSDRQSGPGPPCLQRFQGRCDPPHPGAGLRVGALQRPGQRDRSRVRGHRAGQACFGRSKLRRQGPASHSHETTRPAGRTGPAGDLPGFGRLQLYDRHHRDDRRRLHLLVKGPLFFPPRGMPIRSGEMS